MVPKRTEENVLGISVVERNIGWKKNLYRMDIMDILVDLSDSRQSEEQHENRCQLPEAAQNSALWLPNHKIIVRAACPSR